MSHYRIVQKKGFSLPSEEVAEEIVKRVDRGEFRIPDELGSHDLAHIAQVVRELTGCEIPEDEAGQVRFGKVLLASGCIEVEAEHDE